MEGERREKEGREGREGRTRREGEGRGRGGEKKEGESKGEERSMGMGFEVEKTPAISNVILSVPFPFQPCEHSAAFALPS